MFAVFISVFVTLAPCSIIVKHTAPRVVTFKNDLLDFYQQKGKKKIKVPLALSHNASPVL